jgi:hypothetical protein
MHFRPLCVIAPLDNLHFGNQPDPILFGVCEPCSNGNYHCDPIHPSFYSYQVSNFTRIRLVVYLDRPRSVTPMAFDHHLQCLIIEARVHDPPNLSIPLCLSCFQLCHDFVPKSLRGASI